jgi:DNA repair exonuclease SbcCD nuclease subunit
MRMCMLVFADSHLAAQGDAVARDSGLNLVLSERYEAAAALVRRGIDLGAHAILHCGDLFDGPRPSPTEIWEARRLAGLRSADAAIPFIVLEGNHEHPRPGERSALHVWLALSDIGCYSTAMGDMYERDLDSGLLQVVCLPGIGAMRGFPWGELELPPARGGRIIAAHLGVAGAEVAGLGRMPDNSADCGLPELIEFARRARTGCVVLGHYHRFQVLNGTPLPLTEGGPIAAGTLADPLIFYAGSPTPISFGEETEQKVLCLLDYDAERAQWALTTEPSPAAVRFVTLTPEQARTHTPQPREKIRIVADRGDRDKVYDAATALREAGALDVRVAVRPPEAAAPRMALAEGAPWAETLERYLRERGAEDGGALDPMEAAAALEVARELKGEADAPA